MKFLYQAVFFTGIGLYACTTNPPTEAPIEINASEIFNTYLDSVFYAEVDFSPEKQTSLGIKKDYGKWDDLSAAAQTARYQRNKQYVEDLKQFDRAALDEQAQLSYDLYLAKLTKDIAHYERYRLYDYPVNQMFGKHSSVPAFLINFHKITSQQDAADYVSRLQGIKPLFDQLIVNLKEREEAGIVLPKFLFPFVLQDSRNMLEGFPLDQKATKQNTLYADFSDKINDLGLVQDSVDKLLLDATEALISSVLPAYQELIAFLEEQEQRASNETGVYKWPNGDQFYQFALKHTTTTDLSADRIYDIGEAEIKRIHNEMRAIARRVGFDGDLQAFFKFMRTSDQFYYPNTEAGRQAYLDTSNYYISEMKKKLPELFTVFPKADLIVKAVEPFREKSAGIAFYNQPAMDGSRPGIYYVNLSNMSAMPQNEIEALAYHEALPGHHMQIAIAQELEGLPMFRKTGRYTAYVEGWGLYCERIPKEIGMYEDPYSDFGRLSMEVFRATRLVADVGLHSRKWTRQQAIDYYLENTPSSYEECRKMVDRHCVMPSQATAYKIGMIKILELREKAKAALGDQFDIRHFHDTVLQSGPLPLDALEASVDRYIKETKARS